MKRMREESGQTLIMVALSLTCILGFVGFATDVGVLLHAKRNLQIAADAAAVAGANEIRISAASAGAPSVSAVGTAAAAQNGVSCAGCVAIHNPPISGPHTGDASYVEAIVTQAQPTFFMRLFRFTSMPVSARAVAFNGANNGSGCLNALNTSDSDTIHLEGNFRLNAPGCQVLDESNNPQALNFTGAAGRLVAGSVGVYGGAAGHTSDSSPLPVQMAPVGDPLAGMYTPPTYTAGSCTAPPAGTTWGSASGGVTCYSGPITVNSAVQMDPGTYVFTGTLSLKGTGSLTSLPGGVTLYFPPGGSMDSGGSGNTTLTLSAPQGDPTNPYNNLLIYEDPLNTTPLNLIGTPIAKLSGIIYLPSAMLELGGNTGLTQDLQVDLIVNKLYDFGNADVTISDYSATNSTVLDTIALVE